MTDAATANEHRLPRTVVPERYQLRLAPDLMAATFTGRVDVDVRIAEATTTIVCNAADLEVLAASVTPEHGTTTEATFELDAERERLTLALAEPVEPQRARVSIEFRGILNDNLHGFYRSTSTGADGVARTIATTQFEPVDARRAFPCWDEPDLKATFAITLVVDDGLQAFSNGPELERTPTEGGRQEVRFAETMVMSTYLVAFAVGEFEPGTARDVERTPVRIITPPGGQHLTGFAADAAEFSLTFLADWFGIPYPADKLDHIAIPDFAAGAMENLGLVTYRESSLLVDRDQASSLELQRIATVVAHETAHMWFGDLVTMKWWNGIWLNEAFATFMELTTNHAWHPEWEVWTSFGAGKSAAMALDAQRSTRPVEFAVGAPEEAEAMFDLLTYQKGGAVLRMLELHLGPEVFRAGIGRYLDRHRHANTETADLWVALEEASGEPVRSIMDSWIFQPGHPVVDVRLDGTSLEISQRRFSYQADGGPGLWQVPIGIRTPGSSSKVLLDGPSTKVEVDDPSWVVVNEGGAGFFRVNYAPELLDRLVAAGLDRLSPLERMGLVDDTWDNVLAGQADLASFARLVEALGAGEDDPDVLLSATSPLRLLANAAAPHEREVVAAFARRIAGPAFARIGWDAGDGEHERRAIARSRLVAALGGVGADPAVREEASRRIQGDGPAPDLRTAVTHVWAAAGGEVAWRDLHDRYRSATNPQERERNLYALASTCEAELLLRTLVLSSSEEVRNQNGGFVVGQVLANPLAGAEAWQWVEENFEALTERYRAALLSRMLEGTAWLVEAGLPERVRSFLTDRDVPLADQRVEQLLERLDVNARFASTWRGRLADVLGA